MNLKVFFLAGVLMITPFIFLLEKNEKIKKDEPTLLHPKKCEPYNASSNKVSLRIHLYTKDEVIFGGPNYIDGIILEYGDAFSDCFESGFDVGKFPPMSGQYIYTFTSNSDDEIGWIRNQTPTNLNQIQDLYLKNLNATQYKWGFQFASTDGISNFPNGFFLWDKYLDTYTPITNELLVSFTQDNAIPESVAPGRFAITLSDTPLSYDNIFDTQRIVVNERSTGNAYTLVGATAQTNEPNTNLVNGINGSAWFSFVATSGEVQITTDIAGGTLNGTEIAVYQVDPVITNCLSEFSNFTQIAYDNNSGNTIPNNSILNIDSLTPGETYYIQVDLDENSVGNPGTFGLEVRNIYDDYTYDTTNGYLPNDPNGLTLFSSTLTVNNGSAFIDAETRLDSTTVKPDAVLDLGADLFSNVLFESDENGSAQLDDVESFKINGEATIQQFIPAGDNNKRAYRFIASPVTTITTIKDNWQEGVNNPGFNYPSDNINPNPNFGTHITGSSSGANGFDATQTGNASLYTFDHEISQNWTPIENTNSNGIETGKAYFLFIRGDRSISLATNEATPTNTTLRTKGSIHTGAYNYSASDLAQGNNDYNSIANPYQAVVDFSQATTTGLTNYIYVWDASIGGLYGRGGYVTVELPSGANTVIAPGAGSSDANQFIAPGQSFFVQNDNSSSTTTTLSFAESNKDILQNQVSVFSTYTNFYINSRLYKTSDLLQDNTEVDAISMQFSNDYTTLASEEDALKPTNLFENYAIINNGNRSIDKQALPPSGHEIQLSVENYQTQEYSLTFDIQNKPNEYTVFLQDSYNISVIELTQDFIYNYNVDTNIPESSDSNRFSLLFENTTLSTFNNSVTSSTISLYPNPTSDGSFTINIQSLKAKDYTVNIYNLLGQKLCSPNYTAHDNILRISNTPNLSNGVYIVEVKTRENSYITKLLKK